MGDEDIQSIKRQIHLYLSALKTQMAKQAPVVLSIPKTLGFVKTQPGFLCPSTAEPPWVLFNKAHFESKSNRSV